VPHLVTADRESLVLAHLPLVVRLARRYFERGRLAGLTFDDLIQEGNLGLVRAAARYDPLFRTAYGTYAYYWARRAIVAACSAHPVPTDADLDRLPEPQADEPAETEDRPAGTRAKTLAQAAREYIWLWDLRHGVGTRAIAEEEGVSVRVIRAGLARARQEERGELADTPRKPRLPTLVPLFPASAYDPMSPCPHHGPIPDGSVLCCMVCHRSGMDDHPALQRDRATDPKPDPKPEELLPRRASRETRRQRRLRLFGATATP